MDSTHGRARFALGIAVAGLLLCAGDAHAQVLKRADIAGYSFGHITTNTGRDRDPRVSSNGYIVWDGRYNLPGAVSGGTDDEIFFWDGVQVHQITDDDDFQWRSVVNNVGQVAYTGAPERITLLGDMYLYTPGSGEIPLSNDGAIEVDERYPDINDRGVVVWTRLVGATWQTWHYDPLIGFMQFISPGYRAHINELDHVAFGSQIQDLGGNVLSQLPNLASLGLNQVRRVEINSFDQLSLEIDVVHSPDMSGPRVIAFWDGAQLHELFRSESWIGRADLNDSGVIAFEGRGGLPGSSSGGDDLEIYVYDPAIGRVIQLTDDDQGDVWGTVTGSGRIVWWGIGSYDAADPSPLDSEIFYADPSGDADADGVADAGDNCPLEPNASQADSGGIASAMPDGTGDACQCGDVSDDGIVDGGDVDAFRIWLATSGASAFAADKCSTGALYAGEPCSLVDTVRMRRELAGLSGPGIQPGCAAQDQW